MGRAAGRHTEISNRNTPFEDGPQAAHRHTQPDQTTPPAGVVRPVKEHTMSERPTPVELPETVDTLTEQQIRELLPAVKAEAAWLTDHGDKTVENMRRIRELRSVENALVGALNELAAPLEAADEIVDPAPVAETVAETVAEPAPAAVELAPAAADAPLTETEVAAAEAPDTLEGIDMEAVTAQVTEAIMAQLAKDSTGPVDNPAPVTDTTVEDETAVDTAPAMYASLDNATLDPTEIGSAPKTDMNAVVAKFKQAAQSIAGWGGADSMHMFAMDRLAGLRDQIGAGRLGKDEALNTALIRNAASNPNAAPIMAALCGTRREISIGNDCFVRDVSPFWDDIGNTIPADGCGVKWRKHLDPAVFEDGAFIWDACKQAAVDMDDKATWKPLVELPKDCTDYCEADPFYIGAGLLVTVDQEFCEPDKIQEASDIIQALVRRRLDQAALFIADSSSTLRTYAMDPVKGGIVPNLMLAVTNLLIHDQVGDIRCPSNFTAYVPEHFRKLVALDMGLAGENPATADQLIRDVFALCGVSRVVFHDTWGCEGNLVDPFEDEQPELCEINCTDVVLDPIACDTLAFGSGAPVEAAPTQASIRLLDPADFIKGETGVEDWQLRKDNTNRKTNTGEYFSESRHYLFPTNNRRRFRIDFDALCATGNRTDRTGVIAC